jgi:tRNA-splicing ligase RtcB
VLPQPWQNLFYPDVGKAGCAPAHAEDDHMDLEHTVAAALAGNRSALIAFAVKHLSLPKPDIAAIARGDATLIAQVQDAARALLAPRSGATITPVIVGDHAPQTIAQLAVCLDHDDAVAGAICADGHLGYSQPVGGVVAYREHISVSGVGFDIACGNLAVRTDMPFGEVKDRAVPLLETISARISFGVGRSNDADVAHPLFEDEEAWRAADALALRPMAQQQLGTVGAGNHYVDLFREVVDGVPDDEGVVWIGIHFGSRGLGHKLATQYLKRGGGKEGIHVRPTLLHQDSDLGRGYLAAMELAGRYAYAGREWVAATVLDILDAGETDRVHNHHNFAWREAVAGAPAWVVRKGCTPAFPGQRGFVGGSMGDDAVILEGIAGPEATSLLSSTVHGAGRLFGRKEAKRRFTRAEMTAWLAARGVTLRGGDLDESPMAYRRLPEVLARHAGSVRVVTTLRPFAVVMAGVDVIDPFKD